jgi:hypothetical protein
MIAVSTMVSLKRISGPQWCWNSISRSSLLDIPMFLEWSRPTDQKKLAMRAEMKETLRKPTEEGTEETIHPCADKHANPDNEAASGDARQIQLICMR